MIKYAVALIAAALVGYFLFGNPDIALRSSDSQWADAQFESKGRSLAVVVANFETYKLQCGAPRAVLLRTTPQYWYDVFAWPSYETDRKWRIPYGPADPRIGDYYPPVTMKSCANGGVSPEVLSTADANARRYLKAL